MNDKKAERVIDTFTGPLERKILCKLANALPEKVLPDHLTVLAFVGTLISAAAYLLSAQSRCWLFLASFGFVLNWFGDSLDGTLARVRHIERERYGYFVDHLADALTTVIICLSFGLSPLMRFDIAMMIAIGYLLMNVYVHVSAYTQGEFRISYMKFGPTEIRLAIILFNTVMFFWDGQVLEYRGDQLTIMDLGGLVFSLAFVVIFIVSFIKTALKLDKLDRAKKRDEGKQE
ncbi:MAG: CDP-alcohol phosphatidyltransferase family protein [Candidatus Cloacimonetes bacterium]|jgi:archaetidylinositol phosphate synthase|nr:CDP-alcohol phosphatidyltransferase family protein [Candidatus Cloacimonadota bacterium]